MVIPGACLGHVRGNSEGGGGLIQMGLTGLWPCASSSPMANSRASSARSVFGGGQVFPTLSPAPRRTGGCPGCCTGPHQIHEAAAAPPGKDATGPADADGPTGRLPPDPCQGQMPPQLPQQTPAGSPAWPHARCSRPPGPPPLSSKKAAADTAMIGSPSSPGVRRSRRATSQPSRCGMRRSSNRTSPGGPPPPVPGTPPRRPPPPPENPGVPAAPQGLPIVGMIVHLSSRNGPSPPRRR
jgi:hypothetical protein